jgi:hypothetical protein
MKIHIYSIRPLSYPGSKEEEEKASICVRNIRCLNSHADVAYWNGTTNKWKTRLDRGQPGMDIRDEKCRRISIPRRLGGIDMSWPAIIFPGRPPRIFPANSWQKQKVAKQ